MILITGGTGFLGQVLVRHLTEMGQPVRLLIRASRHSPTLPRGVHTEIAVCSLTDDRGLRSAMQGVDVVYHLAGTEWRGARSDLLQTDVIGTQNVAQIAAEAGVQRIFFVSHLDADRASAYPILKAKGIAEEHVRNSGANYTILRSAILFGPRDRFTTGLARILQTIPLFFITPGKGTMLLQPLWVEDLATCLAWALDNDNTRNQTIDVGGPDYFTFNQILEQIMETCGVRRRLLHLRPPYLRTVTVLLDHLFPALPISVFWLDYLAADRTCPTDTIPRLFNLIPARFPQRVEYLKGQSWRMSLRQARRRPG